MQSQGNWESIRTLRDHELLRMLDGNPHDYEQSAWTTACDELQRRGGKDAVLQRMAAEEQPTAEVDPLEAVLAVAGQLNIDEISRTAGDLVFTNKRLIFAKTAGMTDLVDVGYYLFGLFAIKHGQQRRSHDTSEMLRELPIGELAASSQPKNVFPIAAIESVQVKLRRFGWSFVIVRPKGGRRRKFWGKRKNVSTLLQSVETLKAHGYPLQVV